MINHYDDHMLSIIAEYLNDINKFKLCLVCKRLYEYFGNRYDSDFFLIDMLTCPWPYHNNLFKLIFKKFEKKFSNKLTNQAYLLNYDYSKYPLVVNDDKIREFFKIKYDSDSESYAGLPHIIFIDSQDYPIVLYKKKFKFIHKIIINDRTNGDIITKINMLKIDQNQILKIVLQHYPNDVLLYDDKISNFKSAFFKPFFPIYQTNANYNRLELVIGDSSKNQYEIEITYGLIKNNIIKSLMKIKLKITYPLPQNYIIIGGHLFKITIPNYLLNKMLCNMLQWTSSVENELCYTGIGMGYFNYAGLNLYDLNDHYPIFLI